MSLSATFPAPIYVCSKTSTRFCYSFASWPSMAANLIPSLKSSLAASKSPFLRHNLTMQSSISRGVFSKARFSGVSARAATEKSIYDFTVKVFILFSSYCLFFKIVLVKLIYCLFL